MKLFINDIPIYIAETSDSHSHVFDKVIDLEKSDLREPDLIDNVYVINATELQLDRLLKIMSKKKMRKLNSITFSVDNYNKAVKLVKSTFTIVKAAGGVVQRDEDVLMIYRLDMWDLPKGKLDKGEKMKGAAVREVEEECNIKVKLGPKICNTWHTYTRNGKRLLKKTGWFRMECLDDSQMKPQREEGIDEVKWMSKKEVRKALSKSYRSVRHVFHKLEESESSTTED